MSGTEDDEDWSSGAEEGKKPAGSKRKQKPKQRVESREQKEARLLEVQLKRTAVKNGVMSREANAGDSRSASAVPSALLLLRAAPAYRSRLASYLSARHGATIVATSRSLMLGRPDPSVGASALYRAVRADVTLRRVVARGTP